MREMLIRYVTQVVATGHVGCRVLRAACASEYLNFTSRRCQFTQPCVVSGCSDGQCRSGL